MENHENIPSKNKWLVYGVISVFTALVLGYLFGMAIAQNEINNYKSQVDVYKDKITTLENKIKLLNEEISFLQSKNQLTEQEKQRLEMLIDESKQTMLDLLNTINQLKTITPTTRYTTSGGGGSGGVS